MRKFSLTNTFTAMIIFIGLSLPANAEMIGTGKPGTTSAGGTSCDWIEDGFFTCLSAWWNEE